MSLGAAAASLTAALRAREVVACELGVFFVVVSPASIGRNPRTGGKVAVPPRAVPKFLPSDLLLARVGGALALGAADLREALESDVAGTVDLVRGERTVDDPNDARDPIAVPTPTTTLALAALFDAVVDGLAAKKKFVLSGIGKFERTKIPRGPHRGRIGVAFTPSLVLRTALVSPEP